MRQLSFNAFLEQYILYVSRYNTLNVHKLVKESKSNYRLLDSLVLYCALNNKKDLLNKYTHDFYKDDIKDLDYHNFLDDKYSNYEFRKIWRSYQNKVDRNHIDLDTKSKIRNKTLCTMKDKGVTNYRVYTDLNLNPGNVNAYLSKGDCTKVSLATAMKINEFVRDYQLSNNK